MMDQLPFLRQAMERMDAGDVDGAVSRLDQLYQAAWREEEEVSLLAHVLAMGLMLHETEQEMHEVDLPPPPDVERRTLRDWCAGYVSERRRCGKDGSLCVSDYLAWGRAMAEDRFAMAGWVVDMHGMPLLDFLTQAMLLETTREQGRLTDVTEIRNQSNQLRKAFEKLIAEPAN